MRRYRGKRRRWARVLLSLLLAGILCFSALLGVVLTGIRTEMKGDPEVMIILGCQVKPWGPSVLLQDRLDTALDYLEDHPDMLVIVSGGQGPDEHISEAACMADYLIGAGYDPDL
ncbi:MAG: YdcF family protein, partial [Clostridiales bacterium]|nr:YdcF family protein [Clostridiales bacterium]